MDTRLPYCTMVGISRYPGTPVNQSIHFFLMTNMNFTIARLGFDQVVTDVHIQYTYVEEKNHVFVVGIGSTPHTLLPSR